MRKSGYYWIRTKDSNRADPVTEDGWEVAYYNSDEDNSDEGWYSIWNGGAYADSELEEINETRLFPIVSGGIPEDIRAEMDQDMCDGQMPVGEIEGCLNHWSNKYTISKRV